jgi:sarcosine oxidase subunit gamma
MADDMPASRWLGARADDAPSAPAAALRDLPRTTQFVFRGGTDAAASAGAAFGVALPLAACRADQRGGRAALWLGPDEWLLVAAEDQPGAIETGFAGALGGLPHSLVGVSHRHLSMALEGPRAADVLNAGCPLDLGEAFPAGMCTRTIFGKAPIILWRTGPLDFTIIVWRSFAPYVRDLLTEAMTRLWPATSAPRSIGHDH